MDDKDQKLKIVHYIPALSRSLGGVAVYMQLLAKELGVLCELVVVTRPFDDPLTLENCRVVNIPKQKKEFQKAWSEFLASETPDIVHINGIWQLDTWWIQKEALRYGINTYITPHGMLEPWIINRNRWKKYLAMWLYERKALKFAVKIIATAESEKRNILRLQVNPNVCLVANGIDVSEIPMKTSWGKRKKILYVSRIHIKKGIEMLLEAAYGLYDRLKDYEIVIAGEGETEYVEQLKARAKALNLNIRFIGGVYGNKKWRTFQEADFFVLPTYSENFGYVIAEALACGTPVITTKGAPWKDIETWDCGRWIERTLEDLKNSLIDMIEMSSVHLEQMGRSGRRLIEEKYSARNMANGLMEIYQNK